MYIFQLDFLDPPIMECPPPPPPVRNILGQRPHDCAHIYLSPHDCAQTRLCPDTFVPTHVCSQTHLCPVML